MTEFKQDITKKSEQIKKLNNDLQSANSRIDVADVASALMSLMIEPPLR